MVSIIALGQAALHLFAYRHTYSSQTPPWLKDILLLLDVAPLLNEDNYLDLEPIRQLISVLQQLPGFNPDLVFSRLPRLIRERDARQMGIHLAQGLAERGVVRLVKAAAGGSN